MKFAIYSRKSKFTGKGDSINNQIEMCQNYILKNYPDTLESDIDVYEDEGFSGKNINRPEFQKLLQKQKSNPYDYIIVYRLDRISRNTRDFVNLIADFEEQGTAFVSINENFDMSSPLGKVMMTLSASLAQVERENITERIRDNMYMLSQEGRWLGGDTPLGYKSVRNEFTDDLGKKRSYSTLVEDEDTISLVKGIFRKYKACHSLNQTGIWLNETSLCEYKYSKSSIKRVLSNPVYCIADEDSYNYFKDKDVKLCFSLEDCNGENGLLAYNKYNRDKKHKSEYIVAMSTHKGILTGKEWVDIQNIIEENSKYDFNGKTKGRRVLNPNSLLSGVLRCKCGAYMRPKIYPSGNMFYICENKMTSKSTKCQAKNVNGTQIDKLVLNELFKFDVDRSVIGRQLSQMRKKINSIDNDISKQITAMRTKQQQNQQAIDNLIQALSMNVSPAVIVQINNKVEALTNENQQLEKSINELSNSEQVKNVEIDKLNNVVDTLELFRNNFDAMTIQNKREFIKKIVSKVEWDGKDTIDIFIKGK